MQVRAVRSAARVRGAAVGAVSTTLAVAAHATGGGMLPDTAALLLLLALGTALGAAATTLPWLRTARLGLLGLLGAGQLAGHLLLGVSAMHGHVSPSAPMVAAHAGAVVLAAALVLVAERTGPACAAALARVLPRVPTALVVPARPQPVAVRTAPLVLRHLLLTTSLVRRGPPVGA